MTCERIVLNHSCIRSLSLSSSNINTLDVKRRRTFKNLLCSQWNQMLRLLRQIRALCNSTDEECFTVQRSIVRYMAALSPMNPKRLSTLRMYLLVCSASVRVRICELLAFWILKIYRKYILCAARCGPSVQSSPCT